MRHFVRQIASSENGQKRIKAETRKRQGCRPLRLQASLRVPPPKLSSHHIMYVHLLSCTLVSRRSITLTSPLIIRYTARRHYEGLQQSPFPRRDRRDASDRLGDSRQSGSTQPEDRGARLEALGTWGA